MTQKRVKELFKYKKKKGIFIRRIRTSNNVNVGDVAGCDNGSGYIKISVDGKKYYAHRLAWLYVHGYFPTNIDHINGDGLDNRLSNLREVSHAENHRNRALNINNKSGCHGVWFDKSRNKWCAEIMVDKKKKHLGRFTTLDEAVKSKKDADLKYGFHANHGRS